MWNRKCTPQEAIERAIEWKKAHEITYHGVKYPSLPQCCEDLEINPISVRLYMEKMGFLLHVRLHIISNLKRKEPLNSVEKNTKILRNVVLRMD